MPAKEKIVISRRGCKEAALLLKYLDSTFQTNVEELLCCDAIACVYSRNTVLVYCVKKDVMRLLENRQMIPTETLHLGVLLGTVKDRSITPSLHLALLLAGKTASIRSGIVYIDFSSEKRFLHGKPVSRGFEVKSRSETNLYLVVGVDGEPLGWARIERGKLVPVIDIGWFLRAGG